MGGMTFRIEPDGKTLVVERSFAAARERVWAAYTDPELLARWWGPVGWTTRIKHMDFSDGGYQLYGMTCEDPEQADWYGKTSWGKAVYRNIRPMDSFEYTDYFCNEAGETVSGMPAATTHIAFHDEGDSTHIVMKVVYDTPEALEQVLKMGMKEGFTQTWDRLEEFFAG